MSGFYKKSRAAQTFLSNYEFDDMGTVQLSSHSTSIWTISPPDEENMKKEAESSKCLKYLSFYINIFVLCDKFNWNVND